jgi:hypothetical protein
MCEFYKNKRLRNKYIYIQKDNFLCTYTQTNKQAHTHTHILMYI